ncbi:RidA family protein [Pseudomonas sp. NPDC089554]|uniref:RidA family protein n=1 Tax=Pseudomonas sp. NPDC089554 TaxID=3390653 RepID=UPI003D04E76E
MTPASHTAFTLSNPDELYDPRGNGYSHVAEVAPGTRLLFIAGQGGEDAEGHLSSDFTAQASQALANLETALASRGASLAQVFKLTLLIVDHDEERLRAWVAHANRIWEPGRQPVCTLIPVPRLALDGMLIEIDAVAAG